MDVEQRRQLYMDIHACREDIIGKGVRIKKPLPPVSFALWVLDEMLHPAMRIDTIFNNCAKMFILLECGYKMKDMDGNLYVGINRNDAKDRGRMAVHGNAGFQRAWATLEGAINA